MRMKIRIKRIKMRKNLLKSHIPKKTQFSPFFFSLKKIHYFAKLICFKIKVFKTF